MTQTEVETPEDLRTFIIEQSTTVRGASPAEADMIADTILAVVKTEADVAAFMQGYGDKK